MGSSALPIRSVVLASLVGAVGLIAAGSATEATVTLKSLLDGWV